MRRSSQGSSAGPLRVRNDGPTTGNTPKTRSRASTGINRLSSGASSSMGRMSTASSRTSIGSTCSKRSSLNPHGRQSAVGPPSKRRISSRTFGHELKQDPRPITDRHFKEKCIRELIEFLTQYSYPNPLSAKMLHSPSSKEFIRIFEFMYSFIEPQFKCSNKMEEQFPSTLKALGYPFNISKSAMYAVGSPHTWPTLLAALSWLREQIECMISTDLDKLIFPVNQDDFDSIPASKLLHEHTVEAYNQFLAGQDSFEELENALAKQLRKNSPGGDLEALIHEKKRLENELTSLEEKSDPLIKLKDTLASIKLDSDKMQQYQEKVEQHYGQQQGAMKTLQTEEQTLDADLGVLKSNISKKQAILETQVFSQADIQRINLERRELHQQIETSEREKEGLEKQAWEEERKIAKDQEGIQKKCAHYNDVAQTLELIPAMAENAHGIDLELRHSLEEVHSNHFYNTTKPSLTRMKNQCIDKVHELVEGRIMGQNNLDQLNDQIGEKQNLVAGAEKKLQFLQTELDRKKTIQQQESEQVQMQIDSLSNELRELHGSESLSINQATINRNNERKRYDTMCKDNIKKQEKYADFLDSAAKLVCDHKLVIQSHMEKVVVDVQKKLEEEKMKDLKT